ncbi:MAG: hypothetical protein WC966_10295 [Bradymonadales bacterium]|jgi:hypothetical protein
MFLTRHDLQAIQDQLEAVTGQVFRFKLHENSAKSLLCAWRNDTRTGYVLSLESINYRTHRLSLGIERYRDIETRLYREMESTECLRLLRDPRRLVRIWLGQEYIPQT